MRLQSLCPCSLRRRASEGRQIAVGAHGLRSPTNCLSAPQVTPTPSFALCTDIAFSTFSHRQLRLRHSRHNAQRTLIIRPRICDAPQTPKCGRLVSGNTPAMRPTVSVTPSSLQLTARGGRQIVVGALCHALVNKLPVGFTGCADTSLCCLLRVPCTPLSASTSVSRMNAITALCQRSAPLSQGM